MTTVTVSQTRVAVVTGAARGIGESIALRLADDGLDVAVNDLPDHKELLEGVVEEIQKKGRRAVVICGDASEEQDVKALIDKTVEELGGVDVVSPTTIVVFIFLLHDWSWSKMIANAVSSTCFGNKSPHIDS